MKIKVTDKVFVAPKGSLVKLSHDTDEHNWKSQFDRYKAHLVKHGSWMEAKRRLEFKQGSVLEIQGPIKDRLLANTFEILEAAPAEKPKPKTKTNVGAAPKKKTTKKKTAKKA